MRIQTLFWAWSDFSNQTKHVFVLKKFPNLVYSDKGKQVKKKTEQSGRNPDP